MERIEYHNQEEKEACDLIRYNRKYNRTNFFKKSIYIDLKPGLDAKVFDKLLIGLNKRTGTISHSNQIVYKSTNISPTKNNKLKCTNQHALDYLKAQKNSLKLLENREKIEFWTTLENSILLRETICINQNKITVFSNFVFRHNKKPKIIKEKPF